MIVVVVANESLVALELLLISIDIGVVVDLAGPFITSMLTGPSESLILFRDTSHGSVLSQIQSLSGCVASNFLTLVAGRIWCLVNLDMLDPKNTSLPLEWAHTLRNCLMNLRNPPAITSYSGD